jgi:hypothetical protein
MINIQLSFNTVRTPLSFKAPVRVPPVKGRYNDPQPYLASMESVHQDNIWTCEPRTDHIFHCPFVMARALDAGSCYAFLRIHLPYIRPKHIHLPYIRATLEGYRPTTEQGRVQPGLFQDNTSTMPSSIQVC